MRRHRVPIIGPPETFGRGFPFVVLCPLTTTDRGLSIHVEVGPTPGTGLDEISFVRCELIRSVNRRRLRHRLGRVEAATAEHVTRVLQTLLNR